MQEAHQVFLSYPHELEGKLSVEKRDAFRETPGRFVERYVKWGKHAEAARRRARIPEADPPVATSPQQSVTGDLMAG